MSSQTRNSAVPSVTTDPRFRAGRKLVTSGRAADGAIEMFATLCEEARSKYGEESIEAAACYYEYGNALFRAAERIRAEEEEIMAGGGGGSSAADEGGEDSKPSTAVRTAAAEAAERRAAAVASSSSNTAHDKAPEMKPSQKETSNAAEDSVAGKNESAGKDESAENDDVEKDQNDDEDTDDTQLALEMMETAWAILDGYSETKPKGSTSETFLDWIIEQLPRFLTGIGDVLSSLGQHADAVDAYTRCLALREEAVGTLNEATEGEGEGGDDGVALLKARRMLCEANILVAEEILSCPRGQDIITTETGAVLVKAGELLEFAQGYYDKARDELQETVYLMGKIASSGADLGLEKENACYAAQMLGGVGNALSDREEEQSASGPDPKKQKTS